MSTKWPGFDFPLAAYFPAVYWKPIGVHSIFTQHKQFDSEHVRVWVVSNGHILIVIEVQKLKDE